MSKIQKIKWCKALEKIIQRLILAEKAIKRWQKNGGGTMEIFDFLSLDGYKYEDIDIPQHPHKFFSKETIDFWNKFLGEPITIPKDLLKSVSIAEFLDITRKRRKLYQEYCGFTKKSRFQNSQKRRKKRKH